MMLTPTSQSAPTFNPRELMALYVNQQYDELSTHFLRIWQHFADNTYGDVSERDQYFINAFIQNFLNLFIQPDYVLSDAFVEPFIRLNLTISNVVAMSSTKTTDAHLEVLRNQERNFVKILSLCSARNTVQFDRRSLFDAEPTWASLWYSAYSEIYRTGLVRPEVCANLREHFCFNHPGLKPTYNCQEIYFGSTYVPALTDAQASGTNGAVGRCGGSELDRLIKPVVNQAIRERVVGSLAGTVVNTPNPRKIAVVSGFWHQAHPVYRGCFYFIKSLQGYHVTLLRLGGPKANEDVSPFDEVVDLNVADGVLDPSPVLKNDFQLVFFPDVGMHPASILLANLRFAPIQVCAEIHPVSTWGALIDYFISGADVEVTDHPERNYSERLVLIPGLGVGHTPPPFTPGGRQKKIGEMLINLSCYAQKVNAPFCSTLRELVRRSRRPLRFRCFVGSSLVRQNDFVPFVRDLTASLSQTQVEVVSERPYAEYMALMEEGDFSMEAYHFGGGNTVTDTLFVGRPMVSYQGDQFYNRVGSHVLRMAGLHELIASSEEQYLELALRLIHDDSYRTAMTERIRRVDLRKTVLSDSDAQYFRKAIDYLIANHDRLQKSTDRSPIRIPR